ncbi:MAG: hypothetical protein JSU70_20405 [Phycisphaerales bacterium]|nr:MAG: hypothetical protein JSU70_20405 [Phycisphaerales bacterium]
MTRKSHRRVLPTTVLAVLIWCGQVSAVGPRPSSDPASSREYFKIQVVDRQTGRGVPLVELRTTNSTRHFTDSNGIVAFREPGLMDRDVFFFVESHGYEFPKDGFGMHGKILKTTPGTSAVLRIDRINVAERLYRVTGQGIYRDSILTGEPVPLANPVLNGQVMGQDSVYTCIYHGRLFWMWGDTGKPSYPLGNFQMSGAVSDLPDKGGLDPALGVNLEYFVGEDGFSRPMSPMKDPGLVWLDGLINVKDSEGRERMIATYARLKGLGDVKERGLVVFNDATQSFEPLLRSDTECLPYSASGRAFAVDVEGQEYYYFATPFPVAVRMRVRARWDDTADPNCYEALTALESKESSGRSAPRLDIGASDKPYRWVRFDELMGHDPATKTSVIDALKEESKDAHLYDIESGKKIVPHGGSIHYNAYRRRWIMIMVQQYGETSFLGEVWYTEADTPVGPWAYARKVVTHNKYSFYHPKHHPFFDQDGGRLVYFEGTYTFTFSGSQENATPRYDYNQIMYRLSLDDPRLALPVAVYQVNDQEGRKDYLLRDGVEKANKWDAVESIPFYAIEPDSAYDGLVPIYARKEAQQLSLTREHPASAADPLFYALPPSDPPKGNSRVVPLYEYRHGDTGQRLYSVKARLGIEGWRREQEPLCLLWKAPPGPLLLDTKAKPVAGY